jgi:hypothetical protein
VLTLRCAISLLLCCVWKKTVIVCSDGQQQQQAWSLCRSTCIQRRIPLRPIPPAGKIDARMWEWTAVIFVNFGGWIGQLVKLHVDMWIVFSLWNPILLWFKHSQYPIFTPGLIFWLVQLSLLLWSFDFKGDMVASGTSVYIRAAKICQGTTFGEVMLPATCSRVAIIAKGMPAIIKRCNLGFANTDGWI